MATKTITLDATEITSNSGRKSEGPDYSGEVAEAVADGLIHALPVDDKAAGTKHARYLRRAAEAAGTKLRIRTFEHKEHGWLVSYVVKEDKPETEAETE